MKSALTLMKIKQQSLDDLKRKVAVLENKKADIERTIDQLTKRLEDELRAAETMPDMTQFFGDFSSHIKKRQDQLRQMAKRTEIEIEKLAEQVRALFREIKSYEQVYKNWQKAEAKKQADREQATLDDVALQGYIRREKPHA